MSPITFILVTIALLAIMGIAIAYVPKSEGVLERPSDSSPKEKTFLITSPIAGINKHGCTEKYVGGFVGKLVPEPDNEFDPNAIKVVHQDGTILGYIPAKETATVRMYLGDKFKKYPIVGAIKLVKDEDFEPLDEDDEPDDFFVGRIYIDSEKL